MGVDQLSGIEVDAVGGDCWGREVTSLGSKAGNGLQIPWRVERPPWLIQPCWPGQLVAGQLVVDDGRDQRVVPGFPGRWWRSHTKGDPQGWIGGLEVCSQLPDHPQGAIRIAGGEESADLVAGPPDRREPRRQHGQLVSEGAEESLEPSCCGVLAGALNLHDARLARTSEVGEGAAGDAPIAPRR